MGTLRQARNPGRTNFNWALRKAISRRVPVPLRKWAVSRHHSFFRRVDQVTDFVRLSINGWGQKPGVYFPYFLTRYHNIWRPYATHPPLRFTSAPLAELCHWVNLIPDHPAKPCVSECEHILALARDITNWQTGLRNLELINRLVAQEHCKFVFTYSAGLVEHSRRYLRPELWPKFGYVYPCFPVQADYPRPAARPFTILSIASRFSDKGVPEALEAFRVLRGRHGEAVRFRLVCQVVPSSYRMPDGVTVYDIPRLSDSLKQELFEAAHVLFIPCYSDSAVPLLEACAFGVPALTTRIHHGDEYVRDGQTGFLLNIPLYSYSADYGIRWKTWEEFLADLELRRARGDLRGVIDQAVDRLEAMLGGTVDLEQMSRAARLFHAQRFSPEVHNQKLLRIYAAALRSDARFPE